MEKQKNKYNFKMFKRILLIIIISTISNSAIAQTNEILDYSNPIEYELGGVLVNGANNLNNNTLISISDLIVGEKIKIPGEKITKAITNLWEQGLFKDVDISIDKIVGDAVFLIINLEENPRLSKFKFKGEKIKKSDITSLKEDLKLIRGKVLT